MINFLRPLWPGLTLELPKEVGFLIEQCPIEFCLKTRILKGVGSFASCNGCRLGGSEP